MLVALIWKTAKHVSKCSQPQGFSLVLSYLEKCLYFTIIRCHARTMLVVDQELESLQEGQTSPRIVRNTQQRPCEGHFGHDLVGAAP